MAMGGKREGKGGEEGGGGGRRGGARRGGGEEEYLHEDGEVHHYRPGGLLHKADDVPRDRAGSDVDVHLEVVGPAVVGLQRRGGTRWG